MVQPPCVSQFKEVDSYLPVFYTEERLEHYHALATSCPLWRGAWPELLVGPDSKQWVRGLRLAQETALSSQVAPFSVSELPRLRGRQGCYLSQ